MPPTDTLAGLTKQATADARTDGSRLHHLRLPTYGGLYTWEFERMAAKSMCVSKGNSFQQPRFTLERSACSRTLPEDQVQADIAAGRLYEVGRLVPAFRGITCITQVAAVPSCVRFAGRSMRHRRRKHQSVEKTRSKP